MPVQKVSDAVPPQGVQARIQEEYFPGAPGSGVTVHGCPDIFTHQSNPVEHDDKYYSTSVGVTWGLKKFQIPKAK
jgi:hypothetical protein